MRRCWHSVCFFCVAVKKRPFQNFTISYMQELKCRPNETFICVYVIWNKLPCVFYNAFIFLFFSKDTVQKTLFPPIIVKQLKYK